MSKQDRQQVRTPADVERKYNLGQSTSDVSKLLSMMQKQSQQLGQLSQTLSQFIASTNTRLSALEKMISPKKGDVFYEATDYTLSSFNMTKDTICTIDSITDIGGTVIYEDMMSAGVYYVTFSALGNVAELLITLETDLTTLLSVGDEVYFTENESGVLCLAYVI